MRFTIERRKWLRGEGSGASRLLRTTDQKRCCMGQVGAQCGVADDYLKEVCYLDKVAEDSDAYAAALWGFIKASGRDDDDHPNYVSREWVERCYYLNDDTAIDDAEREKGLRREFKRHGHELVFTD